MSARVDYWEAQFGIKSRLEDKVAFELDDAKRELTHDNFAEILFLGKNVRELQGSRATSTLTGESNYMPPAAFFGSGFVYHARSGVNNKRK